MDASYFQSLYDYDNTVNQRVLDALSDAPAVGADVRGLLAHILASKQVWLARLRSERSADLPIWPSWSADACASAIEENRADYLAFLADCTPDDLLAPATYQNSSGTRFETPVRDILTHVLVHGGHHRGQIARAMRESGAEPINTDYITHVRP